MSVAIDSFTYTPPNPIRSFHSMLVACEAPSATIACPHIFPVTWNQHAVAATSAVKNNAYSQLSASTSKQGMSFDESVNYFGELLTKNGFSPSRKSLTGDDSWLFEFLGEKKACVDVYPSGVVAVIIRKGDIDELYELDMHDSRLILSLLKDAGVSV